MKVNVEYAQTHVLELLFAASEGEEVEIELPNQPSLFLGSRQDETVQRKPHHPRSEMRGSPKRKQQLLGSARGEIKLPSDEEWEAMDKEIADLINYSPLFPTD